MNDSIRRFLESMVEDGTSMEDVLTEVAKTATEMKVQEDIEVKINNLLESAANSIIEAVGLIDPELVPLAKKCIATDALKEIIEYMGTVKDFFPSGLLDDLLKGLN